jgi:hypothetical protein
MAAPGRAGRGGRAGSDDPTLLGAEELVGEVAGVFHSDPRTGFGVVGVDPQDGGPS